MIVPFANHLTIDSESIGNSGTSWDQPKKYEIMENRIEKYRKPLGLSQHGFKKSRDIKDKYKENYMRR